MAPGDVLVSLNGSARIWSTTEDATNMENNEIGLLPQGKRALVISVIEVTGTSGCLLVLSDDGILGYVYSSRVSRAF